MMIRLICNCDRNEYDIRPLVMSFFPGDNMDYIVLEKEAEDCVGKTGAEDITIRLLLENQSISFDADKVHMEQKFDSVPDTKLYRDELKRLIYRALSELTGRINRWGTLTGVRPSKISMKYLQAGMTEEQVIDYMQEKYYCSEEKARLSTGVAVNELRILHMIE